MKTRIRVIDNNSDVKNNRKFRFPSVRKNKRKFQTPNFQICSKNAIQFSSKISKKIKISQLSKNPLIKILCLQNTNCSKCSPLKPFLIALNVVFTVENKRSDSEDVAGAQQNLIKSSVKWGYFVCVILFFQ